jgi:hypothetical protein
MPIRTSTARRCRPARRGSRRSAATPDEFIFGLHHILFICEDEDDFERHVDNPLVKWYAATGGRINHCREHQYGHPRCL